MHPFILAVALVTLAPGPGLPESICRRLYAPVFEPIAKSLIAPSFLISPDCRPGRLTLPNPSKDIPLRLGAPGHNAAEPFSPQLPPCPIIPLTVLFDLNEAELRASERSRLDKIPAGCEVWIEGHACDLGQEPYNRDLSRRRAEAVAEYLKAGGVNISKQQTLGATHPAGPERTFNRRVVVGPAQGAKDIRETGKAREEEQ